MAQGYCENHVSAAAPPPRATVTVPLERGVTLVGEVINAINKESRSRAPGSP